MKSTPNPIRAMVAEDEAILSQTLINLLATLWPELEICSVAENGMDAVQAALTLLPEIIFLDIQMPGKTGLEVAAELVEEWPDSHPFPMIVYVTAYDQFALAAFENSAADYLLKPVNAERLGKTVKRLQTHFAKEKNPSIELETALAQLHQLMPNINARQPQLTMIRAAVGSKIRMIPINEVIYFEATDKYINVVTKEHSSLIRMSLRDLMDQLDSQLFWQIHRATVVNSQFIIAAHRDELGKLSLELRGTNDKPQVSRLYAHLFKQM